MVRCAYIIQNLLNASNHCNYLREHQFNLKGGEGGYGQIIIIYFVAQRIVCFLRQLVETLFFSTKTILGAFRIFFSIHVRDINFFHQIFWQKMFPPLNGWSLTMRTGQYICEVGFSIREIEQFYVKNYFTHWVWHVPVIWLKQV